jgi:hypothetical protein
VLLPRIGQSSEAITIFAMPINYCKCGKLATQIVILKGYSYYLCAKHMQELEQFLGEKLEPITQYYESRI